MNVLDLSLDSSYQSNVSQESPKLVIRNTFLEVQEHKGAPLRRVNSGSDLSLSSHSPSINELKQWSEATSQTGSIYSRNSSGTSTPVLSWADQTDEADDDDEIELFHGNDGAIGNWVPQAPTVVAMELYDKLQTLANGRSLPEKDMTKLQNDPTVNQHIPPDMQGHPSSLGSIPHGVAPAGQSCKPCIFFQKKRCTKGQYCLHCHLPHPNEKPKRFRASKATRERRAKLFVSNQEGITGPSSQSLAGYASGSSIASTGSSKGSDNLPHMKQPSKSKTIISL